MNYNFSDKPHIIKIRKLRRLKGRKKCWTEIKNNMNLISLMFYFQYAKMEESDFLVLPILAITD